MELETAVQVSTNQMKRQEEENKRLQEALDAAEANIRTMQSQLGDHKRKYTDLESQASINCCCFFCLLGNESNWRAEIKGMKWLFFLIPN